MSLLVFTFLFLSCKNTSDAPVTDAIYKGENDMAWAIAHYVKYPLEEMEFNRAGMVKVSFQVDAKGKVNTVKVDLDEEIQQAEIAIARKKLTGKEVLPLNVSVLQSLIESIEKLHFEPAKKEGKPVNSTITTSVEFMLI
jgi:outer membrane biosynthesis protein TonB